MPCISMSPCEFHTVWERLGITNKIMSEYRVSFAKSPDEREENGPGIPFYFNLITVGFISK